MVVLLSHMRLAWQEAYQIWHLCMHRFYSIDRSMTQWYGPAASGESGSSETNLDSVNGVPYSLTRARCSIPSWLDRSPK